MDEHRDMSVLLVTANVGSMFEQSARILPDWTTQFCQFVAERQPDFVALHCQEVGGKFPTEASRIVDQFIECLFNCRELESFTRVRGYMDEEYQCQERFTALGSVYFARNSLHDVAIWDFAGERFHPVAGREVVTEDLGGNNHHVRVKFPSQFSPHRLTRKGYLLTRWRLNGQFFNFVNIHLYHDPSNLVAMEASPSTYAQNRHKAMLYCLERFQEQVPSSDPSFLFGDFNFRLDLHELVNDVYIGPRGKAQLHHDAEGQQNILTDSSSGEVVLRLAQKLFQASDNTLFEERFDTLVKFDKEALDLGLSERCIDFPPSYPLSESGEARQYLGTRCPAWCDRVLYNTAGGGVLDSARPQSISYGLVGMDCCMGDHKPVYLSFGIPMELAPTLNSDEEQTQTSTANVGGGGSSGALSRCTCVLTGVALAVAVPLLLCKMNYLAPRSAGVIIAAGLPVVGMLAHHGVI